MSWHTVCLNIEHLATAISDQKEELKMHARFTIAMPIYVAGFTYLFMFGVVGFLQGEVESQEKSGFAELEQSQVQILQVGEFFCDIAAEPNEIWLGLYPNEGWVFLDVFTNSRRSVL